MTKTLTYIAALSLMLPVVAFASSDRGSESEARDMVRKAVVLMQSAGQDKALKVFNDPSDKDFKDRDLFVFVYDFQGNMLAMGANPRMVGKNLIDIKDTDGVPLARGMIDMVKTKKKGWYGPYKFANPQTQAYEYKKSYCEQGVGETLVCVGIHTSDKKSQ